MDEWHNCYDGNWKGIITPDNLEWVYSVYLEIGGLLRTAKELRISSATLLRWFKENSLPIKSRGAQPGNDNCMKRPEIRAKFKGELNPSKRPSVKQMISVSKLGELNGTWKGGVSTGYYRRIALSDHCSKCGSTRNLHVHHKDKNRKNNSPDNLTTMCPSCHLKLHWVWKKGGDVNDV